MEFIRQYWLFGLGFLAQGLFGTRLIIQLFLSEKQGTSVSPTIFWQISLLASFLFFLYGALRNDAVIIIGQTLSYFIYVRNLQLKKAWLTLPLLSRWIIISIPVVSWSWLIYSGAWSAITNQTSFASSFIVAGAVGQLALNLRYLYQWYYSEKQQESVLPLGFWVISAVASLLVVFYAVHRFDPVLLLSQGMGLLVYLRNITFFFRRRFVQAPGK
jgi:lipid-A-disaccharide synthase-like uncharacterized protein